MCSIKKILISVVFLVISLFTVAANGYASNDSISLRQSVSIDSAGNIWLYEPIQPEQPKKNIIQKLLDYFEDTNKEKKDKKFDMSFIGGPHYNSDTQLGIGFVGAGVYKTDRSDPNLPVSNVSLFGDVSTVGFFMIGIRGNNIFPHDRFRLNYSMFLFSFPSYYWGIGYSDGNNDDNKTKMKRFQSKFNAEFMVKLIPHLYVGPHIGWEYVKANPIDKPWLLYAQPLCTRNYGFGASLTYDTRDVITNAKKGVYVELSRTFRPSWLWNDFAFNTTEIRFSWYQKAWKGSVLAFDTHCIINSGNPLWGMMAMIGSDGSMRGYYEGRYRDKNKFTAQLELRQHIWHRIGMVVWGGLGSVFHNCETFKEFLPNYGLGYRWEFKKDMNIRLDVGFGKSGQWSFLFNVNEAF